MDTKNIKIIKKDFKKETFDESKIKNAVLKSANRILVNLKDEELDLIIKKTIEEISKLQSYDIDISLMHKIVEKALDTVNKDVAKSYKEYRNYKQDFVKMLDDVYQKTKSIMYIGDKENSNTDSALVSTKRSLVYNEFNKALYKKFFLNKEELQACNEGYIYIHDQSARRDTINCCLFDVKSVLNNGFSMGNLWYNEPKTLDVCFDVIGDLVLSVSAQQYGGFTLCEIDKVLDKYANLSYDLYYSKYKQLGVDDNLATITATNDVYEDFKKGWQGLEYKFNTIGSSRGDYPFITITLGLATSKFGKMACKTCLETRKEGQGKKGFKRPVLFPKIVFLFDKDLHDEGKINHDLFNEGVYCSAKAMYPDWLSLTGEGYVCDIYKKYKKVISPMGCRAFLSPWFKEGGMYPKDENDEIIFEGRFNIGAISLNLPMIYMKAKEENKDFYIVLDYYLELIRNLHKKTYEYLGKMKASINPIGFCEGGFYGGNLKPNDEIKPLLKAMTASFGFTALNELQQLHNQKSLNQDLEFALNTLKYINNKVEEFKKEDNYLYAIYGTPAESLCGLQIKQFREKYGIIKGVSDRSYVSNSFHLHVSEDITPIRKQDLEKEFWNYANGGKIQYVRYPINYNFEAIRSLIRRAMDYGFYEGVNLSLSYCCNCGHEELDMDSCPKCGSYNLTKIDRMNGYLSYSRVNGDTRLNEAKMDEIKERKSM